MTSEPDKNNRDGKQRDLVVILHGYSRTHKDMNDVEALIRRIPPDVGMPNADVLAPDMDYGNLLSTTPAATIVENVIAEVDAAWDKATGCYQRIWIIGHSFGTVIARKLVLAAFGAASDVPSGNRAREWAPAIDRLVFLAAVNRGWTLTSALSWSETAIWSLGVFIGETVFRGRLAILDVRRGAPFLAETRLQWLALARDPKKKLDAITVIQVVGTLDDIVAPDCVVDFEIDDVATGQVYLLEAPRTGHLDAIRLAPTGRTEEDSIRDDRRKVVGLAFGSIDEIKASAIPLEFLDDMLPPKQDKDVKAVVFVVHGIRDRGFWTQKIARQIKKEAKKRGLPVKTETSTYGYLAILPFLLPWTRRAKVDWFMDRYVDLTARYPNATFHYVGHSNGTYLLARALKDYPSARFGNVVFAGSVVRSDYDWNSLIYPVPGKPQKVQRVMNYVASGDYVVAAFPKGLEQLQYFDLGGAGHSGFTQSKIIPSVIRDLRFVSGRHSAGIRESQWDEIAKFILGELPPSESRMESDPDFVHDYRLGAKLIGGSAPLPILIFAALLIGVPLAAIATFWLFYPDSRTMLLIGGIFYVWALRIFMMRF